MKSNTKFGLVDNAIENVWFPSAFIVLRGHAPRDKDLKYEA
jgi:hypothetical protein